MCQELMKQIVALKDVDSYIEGEQLYIETNMYPWDKRADLMFYNNATKLLLVIGDKSFWFNQDVLPEQRKEHPSFYV